MDDPDAAPTPVHATLGLTPIVNVKKLRERLALTQEAFAAAYRIPIGTLRDWEQRRNLPNAPACAYLTAIARKPASHSRTSGRSRIAKTDVKPPKPTEFPQPTDSNRR